MKNLSLVAVATGLLAVSAAAQTSQVSGYTALIAIGNARGVRPPLTVTRLRALQPGSAAARTVMHKLRLSPAAFTGLLRYGNAPAPTALVTQAALESATGKTLFAGAVKGLIENNKDLAAADVQKLNALLNDPAALALANKAAEEAGNAVTPRGGGN